MGKQELEIRIGNEHISFEVGSLLLRLEVRALTRPPVLPVQTSKIGSLADVQDSADSEGLRVFYYLVQDLKVILRSSSSRSGRNSDALTPCG